ncbi:hypothetical protein QVD17_02779 [Tagetes erecta]|uniref:Protein BZR1 homolog n=1 Tax=Tagetes erecta TaxID=13708 RepID=A0AAD8P2R6_TARER|nr:hypothetical protein QVD17_02779 [Tagetes erecta]
MGVDDHLKMVQKQTMSGCIKSVKGPWVVHRTTKDGRVVTRHRFPSDQERQRNCERERNRRFVARKIFYGLRCFGNYKLPKKADTIDLLKALCEEAGWHVEQDGTIYKKKDAATGSDELSNVSLGMAAQEHHNINLTLSLALAGGCIS